jgi:hypothetical protein
MRQILWRAGFLGLGGAAVDEPAVKELNDLLAQLFASSAFGGPHEQVEMFRHQNIAEELESQFSAQLRQCCDKFALEALGIENRGAAIQAPGQKVKIVFAVVSRRF